MSDQAAFHADMLRFEQHVDELLVAAAERPLTASEILDIRLFAGVPAKSAKPVRVVTVDNNLVPF